MQTLVPLIGVTLFFGASAMAGEFYVAPGGDDSAKGTALSPWATLQHAVDAAAAGDTIVLRDGAYAGCRIRRSGEEGKPIMLKAEHKWGAIIKGPGEKCRRKAVIEIVADDSQSRIGCWTLDGLDVDGSNAEDCIMPTVTTHVAVTDCRLHDSGFPCIMAGHSDYMILENNVAFGSKRSHGIYVANSASHGIIRGNRSYSNAKCGIHMNGDLSCGPDGLMHDWTVERNVVYDNALVTGGGAINCDGVVDSIFRNNLLYRNHRTGMTFYSIDAAIGSSRNLIANNTVVMAADGSWPVVMPKADAHPSPTANRFFNNILLPGRDTLGSILVWSSDVPGFESDHNVTCGRFSIDGSDALIDVAKWRAYGYDRHGVVAKVEELFVDVSKDDYRLKEDSPAIAAGMALKEVADDIAGARRATAAGYDIGCFQRTK